MKNILFIVLGILISISSVVIAQEIEPKPEPIKIELRNYRELPETEYQKLMLEKMDKISKQLNYLWLK